MGDGKGRGSATSRRFNDLLHLFVRVAGGALVLRVNEVNNLSFCGAWTAAKKWERNKAIHKNVLLQLIFAAIMWNEMRVQKQRREVAQKLNIGTNADTGSQADFLLKTKERKRAV